MFVKRLHVPIFLALLNTLYSSVILALCKENAKADFLVGQSPPEHLLVSRTAHASIHTACFGYRLRAKRCDLMTAEEN